MQQLGAPEASSALPAPPAPRAGLPHHTQAPLQPSLPAQHTKHSPGGRPLLNNCKSLLLAWLRKSSEGKQRGQAQFRWVRVIAQGLGISGPKPSEVTKK